MFHSWSAGVNSFDYRAYCLFMSLFFVGKYTKFNFLRLYKFG